jgi:protein TonB
MNARWTSVAVLLSIVIATPADGRQATLERVRELYIAAAYEEALAAMPPVAANATAATRLDLEQYRALCLLALGREPEAILAVERLVKDHPTFLPSASDTSPRMRALFADARAKLVPDIVRQIYADAKAAFDAKNTDAARPGFERALQMIDSLPDDEKGKLADLRLLVSGFLELSAPRPVPAPMPVPPLEKGPEPDSGPAAYVPPVVIREELPVWTPPDPAAKQREYTGLLQVSIGEDGRVRTATMVKTSHPVYDAAVVRAAKQWTYKPATRNGQPVPSLKNIQVRLVPR